MNIEFIGLGLNVCWGIFLFLRRPEKRIIIIPFIAITIILGTLLFLKKQQRAELLASFLFIFLLVSVVYIFLNSINER